VGGWGGGSEERWGGGGTTGGPGTKWTAAADLRWITHITSRRHSEVVVGADDAVDRHEIASPTKLEY